MGEAIPKQYLRLAGRTVIEHTLLRLGRCRQIAGIVVALAEDDDWWEALSVQCDCPIMTVTGGPERHVSVLNALRRLGDIAGPRDWVLVHDAARPCLRAADLDRLIAALADHPVGGLLGVPVADTLKRADGAGNVLGTLSREGVWRALTPQMFRLDDLRRAIEQAMARHTPITDEAAAIEAMGLAPRVIEGSADNIKITAPQDLALAELFLRHQEAVGACG